MQVVFVQLLILAIIASAVQGFRMAPMRVMTRSVTRSPVVAVSSLTRSMKTTMFMAQMDDDDDEEELPENATEEERRIFDMNRIVRLGRSKDQDGKSNIWSIEPAMEVEEEESGGVNKNLLIGGLIIGCALACLPLFNAFTTLLPDPSDF